MIDSSALMENNQVWQISVLENLTRTTHVIISSSGTRAMAKAMKYGTNPIPVGEPIPTTTYWKRK
jgi:hypothetical protein